MGTIPSTTTSFVEGLQRGDEKAWNHFVKYYVPIVFKICRCTIQPGEEADKVADLIIKKIKSKIEDKFEKRQPKGLRNYVRVIARREIANHMRGEKKLNRFGLDAKFKEFEVLRACELVREGNGTEDTTWEYFWLRANGKSCEEIAQELGKSVSAVERGIGRIRKLIKLKLESFD